MSGEATTVTELRREVERLRTHLAEVEETLQAVRGDEEILAAERLARSILDNATEAIVVCDRTGSVLRTNWAARQLCSSDPHGRSFAAVFPLQYAPGAAADPPDLVSATLAGRFLWGVEAGLAGPGGDQRTLLVSAGPLHGAAEEIIGAVITLADISGRKRAEEELRKRSRQLEAFFDHTLTPLVFLDRHYNFVRVNEAYARACQRDTAEFLGRNHFELYPSDSKAIFDEVVRTKMPTVQTARPFTFADHPEWGVTYWDWTLTPILNEAGEIEFLVYALVDVTRRRKAEEKLGHAERLAALGTFAAGMAHELNNPLTAILMTARHGLKTTQDARLVDTVLHEIVEDAERCARIVGGVLQFARQEPPAKAPVPLAEVLRGLGDRAQQYARQHGVRVELRLPDHLPIVNANAAELEQALFNLLTNAVHASRARQAVVVRAEPVGQRVRICVQDRGQGMSAETREHAFDPFFTTRAREGGTGLGLSTAHGIVTEHGGTIQIESRLGRGTTVAVELPCPVAGVQGGMP